jgi:RHS repeat-associated protein
MFRILCISFISLLISSLSIANEAGEKVTYYHQDHLGTPVMATDEVGNVEWIREYTPYGDPLQNGDKETVGYGGHEYTKESDLTYMGARWYNSKIGRFMSPDPAGFQVGNPTSFNRYTYANNSPYLNIDPDGNLAQSVVGLSCGAAAPLCVGGILALSYYAFDSVASPSAGATTYGINSASYQTKSSLSRSSIADISIADQRNKTVGSYTITFMDNGDLKYYHGKGPVSRMITSAMLHAIINTSDPINFEWSPSMNDREAFKAEYVRMQRDRIPVRYEEGKSNPVNYNLINSPGKKYCVADGGCGL